MQDLSQDIIKELESRGATPKPRWHFILMRSLFWLLSVLSVVVGSIALSMTCDVFFDNDGLHVTLGNLLQVIPYVWLIILGLFIVGAYFGFRQTRKGYRYAAPLVVSMILAASVALGLLLDTYDVGQTVHKYLLTHTNFYDALIYSSEDTPD